MVTTSWTYSSSNFFQPPMPKAVKGTSLQYFKRFYLYNSIMDYHPKVINIFSYKNISGGHKRGGGGRGATFPILSMEL